MSAYESLSRSYETPPDNDVANIDNVCSQRRLKMLFNVPPTRFTPESPYKYMSNGQLQFTKQQLDMRRKVEILKHNKSSTQGNKQTKKEQWSHINNRKYSIRKTIGNLSLLPGATVASSMDCATVATSSKKTDVPGPNIILQQDNSVPLYNYGAPVRSYGFLNEENTNGFEVISNGEIKTFYDGVYGFLACLKITDSIDETSKLFRIELPFTLGYSKNVGVSETQEISGNIILNSPSTGQNTTKVYYSGTETNSGTHSFAISVGDTTSTTSTYEFTTSTETTVESPTVGVIQIDNIFVQTQPDFFYEISQQVNLTTDMSLSLITPCLKVNMNSVVFSTN